MQEKKMGEAAPVSEEPPPKILVADDTPANLVAMRRLLARVHAQVVEARSGNDALAACLDHEFALILLDVQMPGMDGFEVASLLAGDARTQDTPIIFITATTADDLDRLRGYGSGAVDYISKPVNDTILLSKVRVFLDLYRSRQQLQRLLMELDARNRQLQAEVAERRRIEELVRHQAGHDGLTGLPNRSLFMDRLEQALTRARRSSRPLGLLYLDIDGFKPVNDEHGHHAGDLLLRAIAGRLRAAVRRSDTVARLGGDEFAVIMEEAVDLPQSAAEFARKLCALIEQPYELALNAGQTQAVTIGASIGVALFPVHVTEQGDCEALLRAADAAMYTAKRAGKNRVVLAAAPAAG